MFATRRLTDRDAGVARLQQLDRLLPSWATPARLFLLLYLFSALICLTFGFFVGFRDTPAQLDQDEQEYLGIALAIAKGDPILSARRTLGFPFVIAGIRTLTTNLWFLQSALCLIYAFSAPLLQLLVRRLTGSMVAGLASGLAFAVWPTAIFYGTSLYSESVALPVVLLALYCLPLGFEPLQRGWVRGALLSGLLLGVATHVRPMYLLFLPFLCLIILVETGRVMAAARIAVVALLAYAAVILPWSIYVSTTFHRPILVSSNGGETLAGGLTPALLNHNSTMKLGSGRVTWVGPGKWLAMSDTGYLSEAETRLPYDQQDPLLRARAVEWIKAHPDQAAYLELCKLSYMWGIYPIEANGPAQLLFGNIPIVVLLVAGVAAFALRPELRVRFARLWTPVLFVSSVALISWGSWRFRQTADAGLIAFCVIVFLQTVPIAAWWSRIAAPRAPRQGGNATSGAK